MKTPRPELTQAWARPSRPRPIVIIGAGAIVRTAHLPAYARLGYPVAGIVDIDPEQARATAGEFNIGTIYPSVAATAAATGAVFDVAVPGDQIVGILEQLPRGSAVLIQKPMGQDLAAAKRILACCTDRALVAAINFQLRFSPGMLALQDLLRRGTLGAIVDIDVRIVIDQPWQLWTFLERAPRVEVPYHSIHYLDAIRGLAGEPTGVYCRSVGHPGFPKLADARSSIILNYGDALRCSLVMNHTHRAGPKHRASQLVVEGIDGAVRLTWGVNLDYPTGPADTMELTMGRDDWQEVPLRGSWFTEAFEGPMSNLQRFVAGEDTTLVGAVADAIKTMAVVEACHESSTGGGTPVPSC
ncbi:MAG TPA: Gfo/Idh/MocA family oxidoreductase [Vicinamibacterales bacterium]|nr:Gfo/Idh/MocA family oxidoreductase [Vicinamibacterales bacterium]